MISFWLQYHSESGERTSFRTVCTEACTVSQCTPGHKRLTTGAKLVSPAETGHHGHHPVDNPLVPETHRPWAAEGHQGLDLKTMKTISGIVPTRWELRDVLHRHVKKISLIPRYSVTIPTKSLFSLQTKIPNHILILLKWSIIQTDNRKFLLFLTRVNRSKAI